MGVKDPMGEITPFAPHCPYLGLFILVILGTLGLPFSEDGGILMLSGILVTRSVIKVLPAFLSVYPGLLTTFRWAKNGKIEFSTHNILRHLFVLENLL